jgi:hypothetical protein
MVAKPPRIVTNFSGCRRRNFIPCRIPICLAEPHSLQVLGARRSFQSSWVARDRSFPLPRTGRPFRGLMGAAPDGHGGFLDRRSDYR